MCGICACVYLNAQKVPKEPDQQTYREKNLDTRLKRRGPNYFEEYSLFYHGIHLKFSASVLHLRGKHLVPQPFKDSLGNILLWNGEIFDDNLVSSQEDSDTLILAEKLFNCSDKSDVLKIFESLRGPYAFIFYQKNGLLWFGRDIFGRRSLLWRLENSFELSSVSLGGANWKEVSTRGIYCLDLSQSIIQNYFMIYEYSWSISASGHENTIKDELTNSNISLNVIQTQHSILTPITRPLNKTLPLAEQERINLDATNKGNMNFEQYFIKAQQDAVLLKILLDFEQILSDSVKKRVENHLLTCKCCYSTQHETCGHTTLGILFSGGIDSMIIAHFSDRHLPKNISIDLINVAFDNDEPLSHHKIKKSKKFETPDRITGYKGLKELQKINPARKWNFVEVNITKEDLISKRSNIISDLLIPSCTVLDDSIGCAIWYAARGEGSILTPDGYKPYTCPARILLLGMGADEQLAGYSRHRGKFSTYGWNGLLEEISLEIDRIGSRNLGRDDRIVADHGVEARFPFLDENLVSFLNGIPIWYKANLNYPRGIGEKYLLRLLAYKLNLKEAAFLPKRAIQFGSRIARMENSKEKGSDICERISTSS